MSTNKTQPIIAGAAPYRFAGFTAEQHAKADAMVDNFLANTPAHTRTDKTLVNELFKILRSAYGFVAKQNFSCCGSCAGSEIASNENNHAKPGTFYSRQGNDAWKQNHSRYDNSITETLHSPLYLSWSVIRNSALADEHGEPVEGECELNVAAVIQRTAQRLGLGAEWDGTKANCVMLTSGEAKRLEAERDLENTRRAEADFRRFLQDVQAMESKLNLNLERYSKVIPHATLDRLYTTLGDVDRIATQNLKAK